MRIKSGVWYWLAVASGAVGMLYALGFAGSIEALGVISDTDFITAMVLLLLALFFVQLGDHAAEREVQAPQVHRPPPRPPRRAGAPAEPEGRMKKRLYALLRAELLMLKNKLLDIQIWMLKRAIRLIERSDTLLDAVNAYLEEAEK